MIRLGLGDGPRRRAGLGRGAVEVEEDRVVAGLVGNGLDAGEVDARAGEDLEGPEEGAGLVVRREHGRALVAVLVPVLLGDDEEARAVVRRVLDLVLDDLEVVDLGGEAVGDGRRCPVRRSCEIMRAAPAVS